MLNIFKLSVLLQGLSLCLLAWTSEASTLGLTVHVVPLESSGGSMVRAHFTAITPSPCQDFSGVCANEMYCSHLTSNPFTGTLPTPGWCVRQWQTSISSVYKAQLSLGSTQFNVTINAGPHYRENTGRLNQPAYVALPPPLRAQVSCPKDFPLSVKDLDGDKVQCRFARQDKGECYNCSQHTFLQLDEAKCALRFTGNADPGQYFINLMVEDYIPMPKSVQMLENTALSSVPVQLSLTVESNSNCATEPLATVAPQEDLLFVLPYQEVKIDVSYLLDMGSVEFAVVGPPELQNKSLSANQMALSWVRSENNLTRLLPICFAANTESLQSKLQCVWLYQREMRTLPTGTELKCDKSKMTLALPLASIPHVLVNEVQLNSPTCPIVSNSTHLIANISLNGCGTKIVHSGSELVYTNTLRTVHPYTLIIRKPTLILPLACRIQKVQATGPNYTPKMPTDEEVFGNARVWIQINQAGQGEFLKYTANPKFKSNNQLLSRVLKDTGSNNSTAVSTKITNRMTHLDLSMKTDCQMKKVNLVVTKCVSSETDDFKINRTIMEQGCMMDNGTQEIKTNTGDLKIYRLNVETMGKNTNMISVKCYIRLCMPTTGTGQCPVECSRAGSQSVLLDAILSKSYEANHTNFNLITTTVNIPAATVKPASALDPAQTVKTTKGPSITAFVISHAPMTSVTTAAVLTTISIFLQKTILY